MVIDKYKKTAILFSGSAYNIKFSLESQMKNFIIPNNADVFIVTERRCKNRKTVHSGPIPTGFDPEWHAKAAEIIHDESELTDGDIRFIKDTFGDRLKGILLKDDMPEYMEYLNDKRVSMMNAANEYRRYNIENNLPRSFANEIVEPTDGNVRCVVDQYNHVKRCYELMEQYENQNGFKYDYVVRARIDFIVPEILDIEEYILNHDVRYLYIMGSVNRDNYEFADEFCWFSDRSIASKLFPYLDRMGTIVDRKYKTALEEQGNDFRFGAETQWALLIKELGLPIMNPKIFRSAKFTNGEDGFDYHNYMFRWDSLFIEEEYKLVRDAPSDINEHIPTLRQYAEQCSHITELGTRFGNSSIAFMSARPQKFVSYDVQYNSRIAYLKKVAKECGLSFDFRLENVEQIELEDTDLLFIDTNHHMEQCSVELRLHADKARKYIMFHDTTTFWEKGQGHEEGHGLRYAIEPFLETHPEWQIEYRAMNNNGLLILKRI